MMRADAFNSQVYPVRTEITGTQHIPTSHIYFTENTKLEEFIVGKTLLQVYSMDRNKSKGIIVDESSTEESELECVHINVNKEKDANNEAEYEEYSFTDEVPSYFKIFKYGKDSGTNLT